MANISPFYQTTLYAKVSGYLKWIGPDKGDAVKKDQVLAIIDAPVVIDQMELSGGLGARTGHLPRRTNFAQTVFCRPS